MVEDFDNDMKQIKEKTEKKKSTPRIRKPKKVLKRRAKNKVARKSRRVNRHE